MFFSPACRGASFWNIVLRASLLNLRIVLRTCSMMIALLPVCSWWLDAFQDCGEIIVDGFFTHEVVFTVLVFACARFSPCVMVPGDV